VKQSVNVDSGFNWTRVGSDGELCEQVISLRVP